MPKHSKKYNLTISSNADITEGHFDAKVLETEVDLNAKGPLRFHIFPVVEPIKPVRTIFVDDLEKIKAAVNLLTGKIVKKEGHSDDSYAAVANSLTILNDIIDQE